MAAGKGSKVEYTDYNAIQKVISALLGVGGINPATNAVDVTYGYGQAVTSASVTQFGKITVLQWNRLRNDLLKARQHQSGVDESGNLALPTLDTKITEADRAAYLSFSSVIDTNRLVTPPSSQASFSTVSTATRTSVWTTTISMTFTMSFAGYSNGSAVVSDVDHMRLFFNTGGNFKFSSSLTGYTTDGSRLVNESWATLLTNMGIITFGANSTSNTGTGTAQYAIGFHQLTTTDQIIFRKLVEAGNQYTPNQYDLYVRKSGASIIFTPTWTYTDGGAIGIQFEPVNGTLTSIAQMYIASGSNVTIPAPSVVKSGTGFA
jgi:hypothetical protein